MFPPFMQWFLLVNKVLGSMCTRILTGQPIFGENIDLLKSTVSRITRPKDSNFINKFEGEMLSKEEYHEYISYARVIDSMGIIPGESRENKAFY